jgi:predicted CXXCH cytochrome family protein
MKHTSSCSGLLLLLALALPGWAAADPPVAKPDKAVDPAGCVTSDCHANVKAFKVVHGPVNVNGCEACHAPVDVAKHTFKLARPQTEICTFCHQVDTTGMPVVHKPVADGQCLSCHHPHGGNTAKFVRGERMDQLCNECHQDVIANKSKIHGPVAAAACTSCHPPHASKAPKLLVAEGRDLCFACHAEMKDQMTRVKFQHKAVEQDCSTCHDPHASDFPMQVKLPPLELCTSCHEHEPIRQAAVAAANKHTIVVQGDACLNCHTAHGGDLANLLRNDQLKVCMKCHDQPLKTAEQNRTVAAVSEVLDPNLDKHGPIEDGSCGGCHNVHGSDTAHLLAKAYPEPFYQGFALEKYDLCFSCHDKQLVLTQRTTGLTNFRNGEQNLHFVHVNKTERGRNCRACHDAHASPNALHVRTTVPYGNWEMPINFNQTASGGSCAPGCHKPYAYDRANPVGYDSGQPRAIIAPAAAPAAPPGATPQPQQPQAQPQPPPATQDAPKPLIAPGIPQNEDKP